MIQIARTNAPRALGSTISDPHSKIFKRHFLAFCAIYFYDFAMDPAQKPNLLKQILQQKMAAQKAGRRFGILGDSDLSRQFRAGEKPQPIIRRGGRNGSGKP